MEGGGRGDGGRERGREEREGGREREGEREKGGGGKPNSTDAMLYTYTKR